MAYKLTSVTIRTNNSHEGQEQIQNLWKDIETGKIPLLFDSEGNFQNGISPVSCYSNYESDEFGDYDLSIFSTTSNFFENIENEVQKGKYKKYDIYDESTDIGTCVKLAWEKVWSDQKNGRIKRLYTADYESSVPAKYTKDKKNHCFLYIAVDS